MAGEVQVLVFAVVQAATGPGWWAWRRMWRARPWPWERSGGGLGDPSEGRAPEIGREASLDVSARRG